MSSDSLVRTTPQGGLVVRQSDLSLWQKCPLQYKYAHIDKLPREQSGSLTYGSIIHHCVEYLEATGDLAGAIARFHQLWDEPTLLGAEYHINYYVRGTNWKKYHDQGPQILRDWWGLVQWDTDVVLAREYEFDVPIGDGHVLHGTVDKLTVCFNAKLGRRVLKIVDYKTSKKTPTYEYLADNLQFSAYCLSPETPVLMADMTWRPLKDVQVGDRVLAVDEEPVMTDAGVRRRHWRTAEVQATWGVEKPSYKLHLSDGRQILAGEGHRFLAQREGAWAWRTVEDMAATLNDSRRKTPGIKLAQTLPRAASLPDISYTDQDYCAGYLAGATLGDGSISIVEGRQPFWRIGVSSDDRQLLTRVRAYAQSFGIRLHSWHREPDGRGWQRRPIDGLATNARADVEALAAMAEGHSPEWKAGWLAGLYDTDGSIGTSQLNYHQRDLEVLKTVVAYAADLGFTFTIQGNQVKSARLVGDRITRATYCQVINPALDRKVERLDGRTVRIFDDAVRVMAIESVGVQQLIDLTTSTGTFIADGLISHNCYATTCPEFWSRLPNGAHLFQETREMPRWGEWVSLVELKRLDAGQRTQQQYNRLIYAVNALAESVALRIFIPNISGESCRYCDWRKVCGLPELDDDGEPVSA